MTTTPPTQEIDLRPYVTLLWRGKWWILLAIVLGAAAGFGYTMWRVPERYEARALLILREPDYTLNFDNRIRVEESSNDALYDALPSLAKSDTLMQAVIDEVPFLPNTPVEGIRGALATSKSAKPTLLTLSAVYPNAEQATELVNTWATLFVDQINSVYTNQGEDQESFFSDQLGEAEQALAEVQVARVTFAQDNDIELLKNQRDSLLQSQRDQLSTLRRSETLLRDIESYRQQLTDVGSPNPELTLLLLEVRAYNADAEVPLQIAGDARGDESPLSLTEQAAFLTSLEDALRASQGQVEENLSALEPELLALQTRIQQLDDERTQLQHSAELMQETITIITRKLSEASVANQENSNVLQIASLASVPRTPLERNVARNTVIGAAAGAFVGVFGVFFWAWWFDESAETTATPTDA